MGREALCLGEFQGWSGDGKLLLETDDLIFRGAQRLVVPLRDIRNAAAQGGWLEVEWAGGSARFDLGDASPKWAHAINNPKSRIDKLDVKPSSNVLVVGLDDDPDFMGELRARTRDVSVRDDGATPHDLAFLRVEDPRDLERLTAIASRIQRAGAIWIVHPKGRKDLSHEVLVTAAKAAGLVDNKTARFSRTHTALRVVVPRRDR